MWTLIYEAGAPRAIRHTKKGEDTMGLPADWDAERDGPFRVQCSKCRQHATEPTRAYRLLSTGIVEHLYVCSKCNWGTVVRYDPTAPRQFIPCLTISPGRGWCGIYMRDQKKRKS